MSDKTALARALAQVDDPEGLGARADAYIRGKLTPDAADNWRDAYTEQQKTLLDGMKTYLTRPR